jgi:hypothetical protein
LWAVIPLAGALISFVLLPRYFFFRFDPSAIPD